MQPYFFREESQPNFKLRYAAIISTLLLLLLFLGLRNEPLFRLSARELMLLEEREAEQKRDMVFRFVDAPEDPEAPEEAKFLSDASRLKKSLLPEEKPPENDDPISRGNSFELERAEPEPTPPQSQQAPPPTPQSQPASESASQLREEPEEPKLEESESQTENEAGQEAIGTVPLFEGGPKPYRKPTEEERALAQKRAIREMSAAEAVKSRPSSSDSREYQNPDGSAAPLTGLSVETSRDDLGAYLKILRQLVKGNWRIPNIARYEVAGVSVVQFKLHKDGRITDAAVVTSSTYEPLDTSALNAITNTYQAPPLPAHVEEEWLPMKFGFYYNVRPRY